MCSSICHGRASLEWQWRDELTIRVQRLHVAEQLCWQWTALRSTFSRIRLGQFMFRTAVEREQAIALSSITNSSLTLVLGRVFQPSAQAVHDHW
jgi:hypothetical protein